MTNKISYQSNSSRLKFGWLAQNQAKAMDETNSTTLNLIDFIVLLLSENNNKTLKPHIDIDRRNFSARQRFSGLSNFHKDISRTLLEIKNAPTSNHHQRIVEYYLATRKFKIVLSRGNLQLHLKKK